MIPNLPSPPSMRPRGLLPFLQKQSRWAWIAWIAWVGLVGAIAFLWHLGSVGLVDETEPLFAEAARQMTVTGDWITPYFNGATRFDKPPLIYWLMAIAYHTIGVNAWAARLPSALSAIALTALVGYTLQRFGHARWELPSAENNLLQRWGAAWIGSGAIALNLQMIVWGRTGVSDMLLTACIGIALLTFFCGYAQPDLPRRQARWYLAFYLFCALAVLAKGPVGIVVPGVIVVGFTAWVGTLGTLLREMRVLQGSLLFLGITLPWYLLVIQANGQAYIDSFFGYHNVERFTSVVNNHAGPWYFYFPVVLMGFLPWSVYLPVAIARLQAWRWSRWQRQPRDRQLGLFATIWFLVIFGFFTVAATKLPSYTLPLLPAAAILVALLWSDQMVSPQADRGLQISHGFNLLFLAILAGGVAHSANWIGNDPAMPNFPQVMRESGVLVYGGWAWAIAALLGLALLIRRRGQWLWSTNLVGFVAFLLLTFIPAMGLMDSQRQAPLRQLAAVITEVQQPNEPLVMVGFQKPSLVFYAQRPVTYIYSPNEAIAHLRNLPPAAIPSREALIVGHEDDLADLKVRPQRIEAIAAAPPYALVRVRLGARKQ
ncbi:MAG: glycosyltransferase family 39 protein [Synechococcales bacterium]|nr:glycosyltransferase family 39 protein [Synechococcales bacterium]